MKVDDKNNRPLVTILRQLQTRAGMTIILVNEDNKVENDLWVSSVEGNVRKVLVPVLGRDLWNCFLRIQGF